MCSNKSIDTTLKRSVSVSTKIFDLKRPNSEMTKEEFQTIVSLFPLIEKKRLLENLTKEDFLSLCECFSEEVEKWKEYTQSARNQLELLLGSKKMSKEFKNIFENIV